MTHLIEQFISTWYRPVTKRVQHVDGFEKFTDQNHALAWELAKPVDRHGHRDMLHLNRSGVRLLASLIKQSIFLRLHGGVDKRRHTGRVDGRLYNNVARNPPASQRMRSDDQ